MISLEELKEVAKKRKCSIYYAEKEYLQYVFLSFLSSYLDKFAFKGGTCLRIVFNHERASEDLDFNYSCNFSELKKIVEDAMKSYDYLGIEHEKQIIRDHEENTRFEIRLFGPLYNKDKRSSNTLKIDFSKRATLHKEGAVVRQIFSDIPAFSISVMDEREIFAEKIRALLRRNQPRDLYNVWFLMKKGVILDRKLLYDKLKEEKVILKKNFLLPSKREYKEDMKNLILHVPLYEQISKEVSDYILANCL